MVQSRFDKQVRHYIYEYFVKTGQAPSREHCSQAFSCQEAEIEAAFQRLADQRALVLQSTGEVLMAAPFSAVPTAFSVEVGNRVWWGNCIWDALGILALFHTDGRVITACGCCNDAMQVEIRHGQLVDPSGCVHIALPPKDWWKNVVFA